jgi:hypothetical protein
VGGVPPILVREHLFDMTAYPAQKDTRTQFERIVLLLQGGGALGSYQTGVYQALAESDLHPNWVAGISIGAINAAIAHRPINCGNDLKSNIQVSVIVESDSGAGGKKGFCFSDRSGAEDKKGFVLVTESRRPLAMHQFAAWRVSSGSIVRITASQHWQPLLLNERT